MSGQINSNICLSNVKHLMLSVYKSYHQTVKYGKQRNCILQDLTRLEIQISKKVSKTENLFETVFQQPKSGLQKEPILTSLKERAHDQRKTMWFLPCAFPCFSSSTL